MATALGAGRQPPPGEAPPPPPPGIGGSGGLNLPGLFQPPGLSPLAPVPTMPPPPPSAGTALAPTGEGREMELQMDIAVSIESQVKRLIDQARVETETMVKVELRRVREQMNTIDQALDHMLMQLDAAEPPQPVEIPMDAELVGQLLSKVEQQWGSEIRTLKQELHQTILAHNHNADLIKHHKDTIDALRERCVKMLNTSARTSEMQQQLQKLDARMKQQQKQRKLEPLFERLAALERRVAAALAPRGPPGWPGYPGHPAGLGGMPPGIPPGMPPRMMPPGIGAATPAQILAAAAAASSLELAGSEGE